MTPAGGSGDSRLAFQACRVMPGQVGRAARLPVGAAFLWYRRFRPFALSDLWAAVGATRLTTTPLGRSSATASSASTPDRVDYPGVAATDPLSFP